MSRTRPLASSLIVVTAVAAPATAGDKKNPCGKPPDLLSGSKPSKTELDEARKIHAQGSVAITISEEGDVTDARVVRASSPEAANLLLSRAKGMKFKARPGCGVFQTTVNYTSSGE